MPVTLPDGVLGMAERGPEWADWVDALPGLGHGCGHNTMAASGVGAALGLAAVVDEIEGEIVFLGTPAEERGSGKQVMIDDGLFEGIDAALLYHPSDQTFVEAALLACDDIDVTFTGEPAHAAAEPWRGRNALEHAARGGRFLVELCEQSIDQCHGISYFPAASAALRTRACSAVHPSPMPGR